jgi:predicted RNA binding protein YcfA (HicA-like mRNA interferase family)
VLESVGKRHGIEVRKTGGSHFVFMHPDSELAVTIPSERPIKPIYITQFLALLDDIGAEWWHRILTTPSSCVPSRRRRAEAG